MALSRPEYTPYMRIDPPCAQITCSFDIDRRIWYPLDSHLDTIEQVIAFDEQEAALWVADTVGLRSLALSDKLGEARPRHLFGAEVVHPRGLATSRDSVLVCCDSGYIDAAVRAFGHRTRIDSTALVWSPPWPEPPPAKPLARPASLAENRSFLVGDVAIDCRNNILFAISRATECLLAYSVVDMSLLFEFKAPNHPEDGYTGIAFDPVHHRVYASQHDNEQVAVFDASNGEHLFTFGTPSYPGALCVAGEGRVIVSCHNAQTGHTLCAYSPDGFHTSAFDCPRLSESGETEYVHCYEMVRNEAVSQLAFDERRGLLAYTNQGQIHVIGANRWLPRTYVWTVGGHAFAPREIVCAVETLTCLRSLAHETPVALLPNELLFEIFSFL